MEHVRLSRRHRRALYARAQRDLCVTLSEPTIQCSSYSYIASFLEL